MAKIKGIVWSDQIPTKHSRQEFIAKYGNVNCGGCKDLGAIYDKLVKMTGVTPKPDAQKSSKSKLS